MAIAPFSGIYEMYLLCLWFFVDANKSISLYPIFSEMFSYMSCCITHSISSLHFFFNLESLSAVTFNLPGMWKVDTQMFLCSHHSQNCFASRFSNGFLPPIFEMYFNATVLSKKKWMTHWWHYHRNIADTIKLFLIPDIWYGIVCLAHPKFHWILY